MSECQKMRTRHEENMRIATVKRIALAHRIAGTTEGDLLKKNQRKCPQGCVDGFAAQPSRRDARRSSRYPAPRYWAREVCSCIHLKCAGILTGCTKPCRMRGENKETCPFPPKIITCTPKPQYKIPAHLRWMQDQTSCPLLRSFAVPVVRLSTFR